MDHFMPGMDGVETAKIIRSLGYVKPIVALTANVITGQEEMFYANGFDDFISKPIDIRQMDIILNKFIHDKYPEKTIETARRLKNNTEKTLIQPPPVNQELAKIFIRDAEKSIGILESICQKQGHYEDEDIQNHIINSHSMKSALANIGETELSNFALKLEEAGRKKDIEEISKETPVFLFALRAIIEKIKPYIRNNDNETTDNISGGDREYLLEKLAFMREACVGNNKKDAKETLARLRQKQWRRPVNELLDTLAVHLLHSEFMEAAELAGDYLDIFKKNKTKSYNL
jgi:CheY-like chemotaxis protein